jgi:hypothetical protein
MPNSPPIVTETISGESSSQPMRANIRQDIIERTDGIPSRSALRTGIHIRFICPFLAYSLEGFGGAEREGSCQCVKT